MTDTKVAENKNETPVGQKKRWSRIFTREVKRMLTDRVYVFCIILAPLFCYYFFTTLMSTGLPTNLPMGIVDQDNTTTSRQLVRNLDAFQQSRIADSYPDVTSARKAVQRGDIYGFYYIPKGTTRKAQRQEVAKVSFYTNASFLIAGSLLYRDMRTMSELGSGAAARTVLFAKGATEQQAMAFLQPIIIETHPIGNPWLSYNIYLSNSLIPGMLMLFIFMITVYSIGTEIKYRTAKTWLNMAGGNILKALSAKLLPHTIAFFVMGALYVFYLYGYLAFPCHCGIPTMLLLTLLMVIAAQGMGVLMIGTLPTLRLGLSFASLWGVISFSIAGISFPVMAMHPMLQGVCLLFPLRHYFILYVNCALNGYPLLDAWPYLGGLLCFALLPVVMAKRMKNVLLYAKYVP